MFQGLIPESLIPPPREERPEIREDRLWKIVQTILQMHKRPMTAREVLSEIDKADRAAVQGENRRETVRSAMVRKPDVFEKVHRGLFVLKDWPDRIKTMFDGIPVTWTGTDASGSAGE